MNDITTNRLLLPQAAPQIPTRLMTQFKTRRGKDSVVIMDLPWTTIALASVTGSSCLLYFCPSYLIGGNILYTFLTLESVGTIATIFWTVVLYPKLFDPLRHLPSPPGASFFNGQFAKIRAETTGVPQTQWINEIPNDGLIYYNTLMNEGRLLPTSPQALAEILSHKSYDFEKPAFARFGLGRILGIGLILAEGDEHRIQRKNLMPAFSYRHVKDLYPIFWSKSRKLINGLMNVLHNEAEESAKAASGGSVVEIANWASRATLDIIGLAGMGQEFDAIDNPDTELNVTYRRALQPTRSGAILGLMSLFLPQWFVRAIPVSHNSNVVGASTTIKKVCRQLIRAKKQKLESQEKRTEIDIISVALESGGFADEDLVNQMMTFLGAGHETTASAMTWAMWLLSLHPAVQTRLREEVRANLPSVDEEFSLTSETLDKCHYLHAVCNEILRFQSPVPLTVRQAVKPTTVLGQYVPKGTKVIIPIWAINKSQAFWGEDAEEFNPDRWMGQGRGNTGGATSNYGFMTFLHGPRSCIGQQFARAEFACLLAAVVGRFEFELADKDREIEIKSGITARPKDGMPVVLRPLEGW